MTVKAYYKRAFVIIAGPFWRILFFAIFCLLGHLPFMEMPSVKPVIESITPSSIAAQAHIEPNTQILAVDGEKNSRLGNHQYATCHKNGGA